MKFEKLHRKLLLEFNGRLTIVAVPDTTIEVRTLDGEKFMTLSDISTVSKKEFKTLVHNINFWLDMERFAIKPDIEISPELRALYFDATGMYSSDATILRWAEGNA